MVLGAQLDNATRQRRRTDDSPVAKGDFLHNPFLSDIGFFFVDYSSLAKNNFFIISS